MSGIQRVLPVSVRTFGVLLPLLFAGCGEQVASAVDDHHQERTVGAAELGEQFSAAEGYHVSEPLETPAGGARLAVLINLREGIDPEGIVVEGRANQSSDEDGVWRPLEVVWTEGSAAVLRTDFAFDVASVQIRLPSDRVDDIAALTWSVGMPEPVDPEPPLQTEPGVQRAALATYLADAGVVSRARWGAAATKCSTLDTVKAKMAIHHTVTPQSTNGDYAARIRQIQSYHMNGRGWCDIGYHFMVTQDGRVWEARPIKYLGAHVANHNTDNIGISYVGCFDSGACSSSYGSSTPTEKSIQAGGRIAGILAGHFDFAVTTTSLKGHKDHAGAATACPGNRLYARLGDIRAIAKSGTSGGSGGGSTTTTATVQGVVWDLSVTSGPSDSGNRRIDSATVTCSCGKSTRVRAGDAYWSFTVPPGTHTFTATADGYDAGKSQRSITAGESLWASIGIRPVVVQPPTEDPPVEEPPAEDPPAEDPPAEDPPQEPPATDPPTEDPPADDPVSPRLATFAIVVVKSMTSSPIEGAEVRIDDEQPVLSDADGRALLTTSTIGEVAVWVRRPGYDPVERVRTAVPGMTHNLWIEMVAVAPDPVPPQTLSSEGCSALEVPFWSVVAVALLIRRRRRGAEL